MTNGLSEPAKASLGHCVNCAKRNKKTAFSWYSLETCAWIGAGKKSIVDTKITQSADWHGNRETKLEIIDRKGAKAQRKTPPRSLAGIISNSSFLLLRIQGRTEVGDRFVPS